jgi:hypothetical protein
VIYCGYGGSLSDEQLWQVSQLRANADKLPQNVKEHPGATRAGALAQRNSVMALPCV